MNAPHVSTSENHQRNEIWSTHRARKVTKPHDDSTAALRTSEDPVRKPVSAGAPQPAESPPAPAPIEMTAPELELTVKGLEAAWGKADARYDLDADGAVGFHDLTLLLQRIARAGDQGKAPEAAPLPAPLPRPGSAPAVASNAHDEQTELTGPPTIDGLLAAYGTADRRYDLDGDGTVGFHDLGLLLQRQRAEGLRPAPQPEPPDPVAALISEEAVAPTAPTASARRTIEGLEAVWGTADERYDLDGDGTVGFNDLSLLLRSLGREGALTTDDETAAPKAGATAGGEVQPQRLVAARLQAFERSLVDRLDRAGFAQRPPLNLHNLVERLQLGAEAEKTLLERLSSRYPDGLGVNVKG